MLIRPILLGKFAPAEKTRIPARFSLPYIPESFFRSIYASRPTPGGQFSTP
jgi:hypothetical protein